MNPRTIHETSFSEIIKIIQDIGSDVKGKRSDRENDVSRSYSLSRATSALTLVCPNLVSESLSIDTDIMINKAIERKWVTMLQIALSAYNMSGTSHNAVEFIKDFHTNVDANKMDLDDFMMATDNIAGRLGLKENTEPVDYLTMSTIAEDCKKNIDYYFEDDFNESSISSFSYKRSGMDDIVIENTVSLLEADGEEEKKEKDKSTRFDSQYNADFQKNQVLPSEIKKANELVPSMMVVNFMIKDPMGEMRRQQATIGVKCKLYPINSGEMVNKIISKHVDSNILLKLVKVGTREISFFKDFLLAIDDAKINALANSKRGSSSKLFKVLERRALGGKVRRALGMSNSYKPIFSLVISREEADYMLNYNDMDVDNPKVVIPIMEKLNLIYFVIVDESNETAKFLLDGDTQYETLSFSSLEKEVNDGGYKKVVNLVSKMTR